MNGKKFTVEFWVDQIWIDDGFDLDDERALDMITEDLQFAEEGEVTAKVLKVEECK